MRREFPAKVKVAAYERSKGHCEKCGVRLSVGKFAYDHVLADAIGGEPTLENCEVLCVPCHSGKTVSDVGRIAKAKRQRAVHVGAKIHRGFRKPTGVKFDWKQMRYVREAR